MSFSQIKQWEVWNFMSIEHGMCAFDERNIINLKGYNDSGKSAMLTALKVCIANTNQSKQVSFIQDGKDYFRILVSFDDNVQLLRDKYTNGQSLYELYQNGECIFSTKSNTGAITRVHEVPEPIEAYLGLISYENFVLNSRSCFETLIGVETTGSENYKMFNTVLKSEEIATASTLLNTDKNKLNHELGILDSDIQAHKRLIGDGAQITSTMVDALHMVDKVIDALETKEEKLEKLQKVENTIKGMQIQEAIPIMETKQLESITNLHNMNHKLDNLKVADIVPTIDGTQVAEVTKIHELMQACKEVVTYPSIDTLEQNHQLEDLTTLMGVFAELEKQESGIAKLEKGIEDQLGYAKQLTDVLEKSGVKVHHCPSCSYAFAD